MHRSGPKQTGLTWWNPASAFSVSAVRMSIVAGLLLSMGCQAARGQRAVTSGQLAGESITSKASGLTLLDVLQASLAKNPQLRIQKYAVDQQAGQLRSAQGQFDWVINLNGFEQHGYTPLTPLTAAEAGGSAGGAQAFVDTEIADTSTVSLSAMKQFRDGITVTPSVQTIRTTDNILNESGVNASTVGLQIVFPLLRNRGKDVTGVQEISGRKLLDASGFDLDELVSDTLASAASRYWALAASERILAVYQASEARGKDLLAGTEILVDADRLPANDLNQVRANLASRVSSRIAAEQNVLQAREQIVLVMGLPADTVLSLPPSVEAMPDTQQDPGPVSVENEIQLANSRRADVMAARERVASNLALERAAQNELKPQLDISPTVGYTGLREGTSAFDFPRSIVTPPRGVNFAVGLTYSRSPSNNNAAGRLASVSATLHQSQVALLETSRVAATAAVVAQAGVYRAIAQLQKAREAVQYYRAALQGEREKYRLGLNSMVDVLTVEDRLTSIVITEVNSQLTYALALVQLRQATGTIVQAGHDVQQIDPTLFSRMPESSRTKQ